LLNNSLSTTMIDLNSVVQLKYFFDTN